MRNEVVKPIRVTWLVPDDRGGGVVSVAQACCGQAALAGCTATLLLVLPATGHVTEFGGMRLENLGAKQPYADVPARLIGWLAQKPQDILVLNGCEQADVAIPHVPQTTRLIYVVHDTADRYFAAALRHEEELDAIVAVSKSVAERFRHRLRDPTKLHVVLNGTLFPERVEVVPASERAEDIVFLGGDNPIKGSFDVLALWNELLECGFTGRLHWFGAIGPVFRARIAQLPAAERIVIHGRQPRSAIFDIASRAKVVLNLSRAESFGMATAECMGMGCLPVAWDIPIGTKEIVLEGEGVFASLGNFNALANGIMRVLDWHASRFAVSTERIRTEFSAAAMWSRYEAVFEKIFQSSPVPRPRAGQRPPNYQRPVRFYQLLPSGIRSRISAIVGRSPHLGYVFRNLRGR